MPLDWDNGTLLGFLLNLTFPCLQLGNITSITMDFSPGSWAGGFFYILLKESNLKIYKLISSIYFWCQIFDKLGTWLSPSDVVRSWLRLQSPVDCISHPYHIHKKKCFSTLIYCGWAHECTLTLLHLCRWGWIFGKLGTWLSSSDVVRSLKKCSIGGNQYLDYLWE